MLARIRRKRLSSGRPARSCSCSGDTCTVGGVATTLHFHGVWTYVATDQTRRAFVVGDNGAIFY